MDHDPLPGDHPETERVSTGVLPPDTDVQALVAAGYERYRHLGEGAVADYIPALAAASPSAFGVCVAGVGGRLFSAGDADQEFAIESISKLFVFALVCPPLGHEQARRKLEGERLAGARRADERNGLPDVDREAEVAQHLPAEGGVAVE